MNCPGNKLINPQVDQGFSQFYGASIPFRYWYLPPHFVQALLKIRLEPACGRAPAGYYLCAAPMLAVLPAHPRRPRDKVKVEDVVLVARQWMVR